LTFINNKQNNITIDKEAAEVITKDVRAQESGSFTRVGSLAIIPVFGVISRRTTILSQFSGGTSTEKIGASIRRAVNDSDVSAIVLDIDSPGGRVTGVQELVAEILEARKEKKIIAAVSGIAASAAFWIAAAASEITLTPSGMVGSIGAFIVHDDISESLKQQGVKTTLIAAGKFKVDGNPFEPLSKTARAEFQKVVDAVLVQFTGDVAAGRNVSVSTVNKDFGEGNMLMAEPALAAGMVDRIATTDQTIRRLLRSSGRDTSATAGTVRDFETFLREEGALSNAEAKRIASIAFKKGEAQRDAEADPEVAVTLREIRNIFL